MEDDTNDGVDNPLMPEAKSESLWDEMGPAAREVGQGWREANNWRWVDAVAWIARRDPDLMVLVRAYRFYIRSHIPDAGEDACRNLVYDNQVPITEYATAEQLLKQALEDGKIAAMDVATNAPLGAGHWATPIKRNSLEQFLGPHVPEVFLDRQQITDLWPQPAPVAQVQPEMRANVIETAALPRARRGGAKSGPRPQRWAEHLVKLFRLHHDRIALLSIRERHQFVLIHCTDLSGRPGSSSTTDRHWCAHLERRARDLP